LSVIPAFQWDAEKEIPLQRKPCKFHFINLSVALAFHDDRLASVHDFERLSPSAKAVWIEWLVAQELFRRQCIRGLDSPEALYFWASKDHEIDFVDADQKFYEVKLGKVGPREFSWFSKTFHKKKLLIIGAQDHPGFETPFSKAISLEQFLLADGFPHPYPGLVDDPDQYNDFTRFAGE
jgi:predicted AAA+ superfamily ATPase